MSASAHPRSRAKAILVLVGLLASHASAASLHPGRAAKDGANCCKRCRKVRFATFNTSLNRDKAGQLLADLRAGDSAQAANVSAILQHIRPDVVLLNEFDYEPNNTAVEEFQRRYLEVAQAPGLEPLRFPYVYTAEVNTGVPSGRDFDHDGKSEGPQDAFGFGNHPGQYGMVLLSRFPIDAAAARTFRLFLWKDMPGAVLPADPDTGAPWYSPEDLEVFRLSSKSHWDVPVDIPVCACCGASARVHMLLHHPVPPAFDGRERRNVLRNHDEIRLFADYVGCGACAAPSSRGPGGYMVDDAGVAGGLDTSASFVILGDHNADPLDGNSYERAISQLIDCCRISSDFVPTSPGGREAGNRRPTDRTPPETKTSSFNLRVDYVLPSRDLRVLGGAVWWPVRADPLSALLEASDHRPVFLDVEVCARPAPAAAASL